jgi:hypothetical protein
MNEKFFRDPFYIFCYLLEPCTEIWNIFLNFGRILAVENLKKYWFKQFLIFLIWMFGGYI